MPIGKKPVNGFDKRPQDINRKGGPKKDWTWAGLIEKEADVVINGQTRKVRVVKAVFKKGEAGDIQAFKEISNRTDGMPKGSLDVTSAGKGFAEILDEVLIHGTPLVKKNGNKRKITKTT